jgi:hypothetical protein
MKFNSVLWLVGFSFLALLFMGGGYWLRGRAQNATRSIPQRWPLHARVLVNRDELRVWHWLNRTFDDHHVMLKMPVTRYTRPNASGNGRYLYELLRNTNCTFSVCAPDGHVVGCIDMPKSLEMRPSTRNLKENLLAQCGISYLVVHPQRLPSPDDMRNEILGEDASRARSLKREEAEVEAARIHLRKTLLEQRHMRSMRKEHSDSTFSSGIPSQWHDSFLIQANSLPAELRTADGYRLV